MRSLWPTTEEYQGILITIDRRSGMSEDGKPVRQCDLPEPADLHTAFDEAGIEHLDVDDERTVVIYLSAVLEVIVDEGQLTDATAFTVELWEPPADDTTQDGADLLATFVDELRAVIDTTTR